MKRITEYYMELIRNSIPKSWFNCTNFNVLITAYRVHKLSEKDIAISKRIIELSYTHVCIVLVCEELPYLDMELRIESDQVQSEIKNTSKGVYLLFITPFKQDGNKNDEQLARKRTSIAVGLVAAISGRSTVYEKIYDNTYGEIYDKSVDKIFRSVGHSEKKLILEKAKIDDIVFDTISNTEKIIANRPDLDREDIIISLRCFESAIYDDIDAFAYTKYWTALEVLAKKERRLLKKDLNLIRKRKTGRHINYISVVDKILKIYNGRFGSLKEMKHHELVREAKEYNETQDFKDDMKDRAHIEPKQAEMKRFHGMARAKYWGLPKVNIQFIITAIIVNVKRFANVLGSVSYLKTG